MINLETISQELARYKEAKEKTTPGTWYFHDDDFQGSGDIIAEPHTRPLATITAGWTYVDDKDIVSYRFDAENGQFIAIAKNTPLETYCEQLVEEITIWKQNCINALKEIENRRTQWQILQDDLINLTGVKDDSELWDLSHDYHPKNKERLTKMMKACRKIK